MDREAIEARLEELEIQLRGTDVDIDAVEKEIDELLTRQQELIEDENRVREQRNRIAVAKAAREAPELSTLTHESTQQPGPREKRDIVSEFMESGIPQQFKMSTRARTQGKVGVTFEGLESRAIFDSDTTAFLNLAPLPGIQGDPRRPLRLADLISRIPVSQESARIIVDTTPAPYAGNAAFVADGAEKPESNYTFDVVTENIGLVAHTVDIHRNTLMDRPMLEGMIRTRMQYGIEYVLDDSLINGTGVGDTLVGLLNRSGIGLYDTGNLNNEARLISLRKAKTITNKLFYSANVACMTEDDWALVELSTDTTGAWRFITNPVNGGTPTVWGMSVVVIPGLPAETALIGDFKLGAALLDRMAPTLYLTDSDEDKFRRNIITMLYELRAGLACFRPKAFCRINFRGTI